MYIFIFVTSTYYTNYNIIIIYIYNYYYTSPHIKKYNYSCFFYLWVSMSAMHGGIYCRARDHWLYITFSDGRIEWTIW